MPDQTFSNVQPIEQSFSNITPIAQSTPPAKASFWDDPKGYLENRSAEMGQEAQRQMNMAIGPESEKRSTLAKLGHSLLSLAPETAGVVDKLVAGGMDWKNALVMASGAVDPAIPAAYFGSQGAGQLTGVTPGVEGGNTSPGNVQNALLAGSAVAGAGAVSGSPSAGTAIRPGQAISRSLLLGRTPNEAMQSALKPSTTLSSDQRASIAQTALDQKITPSQSGLEKVGDLVDVLNQKIAAKIKGGAARGATVDPNAVAARTADTRAQFAQQVTPASDLAAIDATTKEFLDTQKQPIPADAAQAMKQGTYRVLKGKYGEQGSAAVEAQKALARGLKEELANQFPELQTLNAAESKLLDLQPVLDRAVSRLSNHQFMGIGTPITIGATKAVTGSIKLAAAAGVIKAVLDDPMVKARLAISLNKTGMPYSQAVSRVQSYRASLANLAPGLASSSNADTSADPNTQ